MLINAFKLVKNDNLKAKLCIIGKGPQEEEIIETIKNNNLEEHIVFLGSKENIHIPAYYQNADAFISASTTETQGLTYIEALSTGLIVLGRYDEVVQDIIIEDQNGFLFDDENELFEKIKHILSLSDKQIKTMKENATNSSKQYDADIFVQEILKTYKKAIEDYNK